MDQKQFQATINAYIAEMSRHYIHLQHIGTKQLPWHGAGKEHFELRFEGKCSKDALKAIDFEEPCAGVTIVDRKLRHDAEGVFDPALGFVLIGRASFDE